MNAATFHDYFMGTSDVLKVLKIWLMQFETFQNNTNDHKSQNACESSHDFLLFYYNSKYSTKSLHLFVAIAIFVLHYITSF